MNILVTGGAGFIGSNFVRYWLENYPDDRVVNLDLLTYAGNPANLQDVAARASDRYTFVRGDIGNIDLAEHLVGFEDGMRRTVEWYVAHEAWWRPLKERLSVQESGWGR